MTDKIPTQSEIDSAWQQYNMHVCELMDLNLDNPITRAANLNRFRNSQKRLIQITRWFNKHGVLFILKV